ncbi:Tn3 family transposase [Nonomuraea angiospora]|uniref:Tn3 family transposase n=1 Tax=Nonomuraea angiospora TaxID=46172 RepID=UPI003EB8D060
MVATDNASYSDMVFGLFKILGYNFSPRFRDLDDQRFWWVTMPGVETGTYGTAEDLARNRVNLNKVITHWLDMLKVAGSLVTNQVRAYDLLRMFGREGRPTQLGAAFAEYGRIAKTEHLLPCARCATRTRPSWTRTTKAWTERPHRVTRAYQVAGALGNRKRR